ncbi:phosphotransferase [Paenibacillus sp. HJL G12]|uniref:Phosphotransferase n=1 Tax=Paenibacillus dendrobii TaxID=2691084 RepID=A0A7X3IIG8_9BACL|nr:aminoglycoside phosphotransferase family protein [Paenibacillus dendrobii]MWV44532.1 phosphotransferase [Paenibacillus dendrobii]
MNKNEEVIAAGRTAELFACEHQRVLKLFRDGIPRELAEKEFKISEAMYQSGISVPQPFEMREKEGRLGIVYEKAEGMTMLAAISQNPGIVEAEARRMAKLHAEIHKGNVEGLTRQKALLASQIAEAPFLTEDEKNKIVAGLDLLEEGFVICHGDYHPDNIIVGSKVWVIDWMTATSGNPAADVARTLLMLRTGTLPEELPPQVQELFARIREQLTSVYLQEYMNITGISYDNIKCWMVPVAAARLVEWIPEKEKEKLLDLIRKPL